MVRPDVVEYLDASLALQDSDAEDVFTKIGEDVEYMGQD